MIDCDLFIKKNVSFIVLIAEDKSDLYFKF